MKVKQLYRVVREDGGVTHTPNRPDEAGYTILHRLIADEGKVITDDGINFYECIDTEEKENFIEIDKPEESEVESDELNE